MTLKKIKITHELNREELEGRLRNVTLRGFPDVKIYENADFEFIFLTPKEIKKELHTPQLRVYKTPNLKRISRIHELFSEKGIDILNLNNGYDYLAFSEDNKITEWTIISPIVEKFFIPKNTQGFLDYNPLIGSQLKQKLDNENLNLNPQLSHLKYSSETGFFDLINDGSHRVHYGFKKSGIKILKISNVTEGFPYYAAPQKYNIMEFNTREEALKNTETKIHIIESPGHKYLYRLFPTGGIKIGDIRPDKNAK